MGYRNFTDSEGHEWQAWDVIPQLAERRKTERRVSRAPAVTIERRHETERRLLAGKRPVLLQGLNSGWLCFEAPHEKRRLAPVPADWMRCAIAQLEKYCRMATPAHRVSPAFPIPAVG